MSPWRGELWVTDVSSERLHATERAALLISMCVEERRGLGTCGSDFQNNVPTQTLSRKTPKSDFGICWNPPEERHNKERSAFDWSGLTRQTGSNQTQEPQEGQTNTADGVSGRPSSTTETEQSKRNERNKRNKDDLSGGLMLDGRGRLANSIINQFNQSRLPVHTFDKSLL